ncbi:alpha/beta fold hydrolase [Spirosoma areae]
MAPTWLDTYGLTGQLRADRRWAEASRPGIRYITLPKATVRVRVLGKGKRTVVFSTDPPCCIEHFDALFDKLSTDYTVVCFEAPGFGFTHPNRNFRFTPDDYAEVLTGLLRQLALGPYTLAFECVSAYSALMVAAREPRLVERLIVMQAPVWSEEQKWMQRLDAKKALRKPVIGQIAMALSKRRITNYWYPIAVKDRFQVSSFTALAHDALDHGACYCLSSFLQVWHAIPDLNLEQVNQPALVIWGNADRSHAKTDKPSTLLYLTNAAYEEWNDAGHFPELEQTDRFIQRLNEFTL